MSNKPTIEQIKMSTSNNYVEAIEEELIIKIHSSDEHCNNNENTYVQNQCNGRCYHKCIRLNGIIEDNFKSKRISNEEFNELYSQCQYRIENDRVIEINVNKVKPLTLFYPTCRFCGQINIPDKEYASQDAANEFMLMHCDCSDARAYQYTAKVAAERDANIKRIKESINDMKSYCASRGAELTPDILEHLYNSAIFILVEKLSKFSTCFARIKVSISRGKKGNISLSFSYSDSAKTEV